MRKRFIMNFINLIIIFLIGFTFLNKINFNQISYQKLNDKHELRNDIFSSSIVIEDDFNLNELSNSLSFDNKITNLTPETKYTLSSYMDVYIPSEEEFVSLNPINISTNFESDSNGIANVHWRAPNWYKDTIWQLEEGATYKTVRANLILKNSSNIVINEVHKQQNLWLNYNESDNEWTLDINDNVIGLDINRDLIAGSYFEYKNELIITFELINNINLYDEQSIGFIFDNKIYNKYNENLNITKYGSYIQIKMNGIMPNPEVGTFAITLDNAFHIDDITNEPTTKNEFIFDWRDVEFETTCKFEITDYEIGGEWAWFDYHIVENFTRIEYINLKWEYTDTNGDLVKEKYDIPFVTDGKKEFKNLKSGMTYENIEVVVYYAQSTFSTFYFNNFTTVQYFNCTYENDAQNKILIIDYKINPGIRNFNNAILVMPELNFVYTITTLNKTIYISNLNLITTFISSVSIFFEDGGIYSQTKLINI